MAKTEAERKQASRDRKRAAGFVKKELWLKKEQIPLFEAFKEKLKDENTTQRRPQEKENE